MTVIADNYAKVLFDRNIAPEQVEAARALLADQALFAALENPFVGHQSKHKVIDALFPEAMRTFIKVMSDNGDISLCDEMFLAYDALVRNQRNAVQATFTYVTKPDDAQIEKLKRLICKQYGKTEVELSLREDPSIVGGFVLAVGDSVLDKSVKTAILKMQRHFAVR